MSRKTITLEVDSSAQEELIRNYHALVMELNDLALPAPDGVVIDQLEDLAIQRGRETLRVSLQQAVQKRIDDAEKKRRRLPFLWKLFLLDTKSLPHELLFDVRNGRLCLS